MRTLKMLISELVQGPIGDDKVHRRFDFFDLTIVILICINAVMVIAETFTLPDRVERVFKVVEIISIIVFSVEYLLRIWTADVLYPEIPAWRARLRYLVSFMAVIDLLAILPFYLPFLIVDF